MGPSAEVGFAASSSVYNLLLVPALAGVVEFGLSAFATVSSV